MSKRKANSDILDGIALLGKGVGFVTNMIGDYKTEQGQADNREAKRILDSAREDAEYYRDRYTEICSLLGEKKIAVGNSSLLSFRNSFRKLRNINAASSIRLDDFNKFISQFENQLQLLTDFSESMINIRVTNPEEYNEKKMECAVSIAMIGNTNKKLEKNLSKDLKSENFYATKTFKKMDATQQYLTVGINAIADAAQGIASIANAATFNEQARINLSNAQTEVSKLRAQLSVIEGVTRVASMYYSLLIRLDALFVPLVYQMECVIENNGTDVRSYQKDEKGTVMAAASLAKTITGVLSTSILENDALNPKAEPYYNKLDSLSDDQIKALAFTANDNN